MATLFSPWRTAPTAADLRLADIVDLLTETPVAFRFSAYDGSRTGPEDAAIGLHVTSPRGVIVTMKG